MELSLEPGLSPCWVPAPPARGAGGTGSRLNGAAALPNLWSRWRSRDILLISAPAKEPVGGYLLCPGYTERSVSWGTVTVLGRKDLLPIRLGWLLLGPWEVSWVCGEQGAARWKKQSVVRGTESMKWPLSSTPFPFTVPSHKGPAALLLSVGRALCALRYSPENLCCCEQFCVPSQGDGDTHWHEHWHSEVTQPSTHLHSTCLLEQETPENQSSSGSSN